jgi:cytochrome c553
MAMVSALVREIIIAGIRYNGYCRNVNSCDNRHGLNVLAVTQYPHAWQPIGCVDHTSKDDIMKKIAVALLTVALAAPAALAADLASDPNYKKCAPCHGAAGEGKGKVAPLKASAAKSEADLTKAINAGVKPGMPGYDGKLKADEVKALVAEIKALK